MYRLGHTGIALLVLAPLNYVLFEANKPLLAIVIAIGVLGIEPLPDVDFKVSFLDHRGTSHSLFAVVVVGAVIGFCGWVVAGQVSTVLPPAFAAASEAVTTVATTLQSVTSAGAGGRIADLLRTLADSLEQVGNQLQGLDRLTVAGFGFAIGAGGILVHLLGDVITESGIRPLLPVSSWRISLSPLRANSTLANTGLFAIGALAVAVVLVTTVVGVGFGGVPGNLSPVGVAAGQSANQSQNATEASVVFTNQTTNGSTVTVQSVTLAQPGYVALHSSAYATGPAPADVTVIAVSQRLSAGTYRNLTINVSNAPPGNAAGLNRSQLNDTQTLAATVYADTNGNRRYDYARSFGENDTLVTNNGSPVSDAARVRVPSPPRQTASVAFRNQTIQNNTLVVANVSLPRGGFVIGHNASYQRTGNAVGSAVAISRYLPPGNYSNVTLDVAPGALDESQTVTIRPSLDTNNNQRYDFVRTGGFQDTAYVNRTSNQSAIVNDTALVRAPDTQPTRTQPATATEDGTATATSTSSARAAGGESGGFIGRIGIGAIVIILVGVVVGAILVMRVTR
jgi:membrane-bound metal-dependent hydrolase YbcI (DUF457 family)